MALLYSDLIEIASKIENDPRQVSNRTSTLAGKTGYLTSLGKTREDPIGSEFFDQAAISAWLSTKSLSTARAAKSHLTWWQHSYRRLLYSSSLPTDPKDRLSFVIRQHLEKQGMTRKALAELTGIPVGTLGNWIYKKGTIGLPVHQVKLEEALSLIPGTLASCVVWQRRDDAFCPRSMMPELFRTSVTLRYRLRRALPEHFPYLPDDERQKLVDEHAARIVAPYEGTKAKRAVDPYSLRLQDLSDRAKQEIDDFIRYKTADVPRLARPKMGRIYKQSSITNWERIILTFYGWFTLPTRSQYQAVHGKLPEDDMLIGAGGSVGEVTLGLFAVPSLIEEYVYWRTSVRAKSATYSTKMLLNAVASLVRPETGYLLQSPELVQRVPVRYLSRHLDEHRAFLLQLKNERYQLDEALRESERMRQSLAEAVS